MKLKIPCTPGRALNRCGTAIPMSVAEHSVGINPLSENTAKYFKIFAM